MRELDLASTRVPAEALLHLAGCKARLTKLVILRLQPGEGGDISSIEALAGLSSLQHVHVRSEPRVVESDSYVITNVWERSDGRALNSQAEAVNIQAAVAVASSLTQLTHLDVGVRWGSVGSRVGETWTHRAEVSKLLVVAAEVHKVIGAGEGCA